MAAAAGAQFQGKSGFIWSANPPNPRRAGEQDIVRNQQGPSQQARNIDSILSAFQSLFPDEILERVVYYTNLFGERRYPEEVNDEGVREGGWLRTNITEIKAFVGLLILTGPLAAQHESVQFLWTEDPAFSPPIFPATISRNRFFQLLETIRFDDLATRAERLEHDKLAPIREIVDIVCARCRTLYHPSPFLTVNEQLIRFFGHCGFRVYIPSKPDK